MMRVAELHEKYRRKIKEAERTEAEAPLSTVYEIFVEDLEQVDRLGEERIYLTTSEVAPRFSVEPETVARWCRNGRFSNAFKSGKQGDGEWRIPVDDVEDFSPTDHVEQDRVHYEKPS